MDNIEVVVARTKEEQWNNSLSANASMAQSCEPEVKKGPLVSTITGNAVKGSSWRAGAFKAPRY